MCHLR
jgi:hypothetical protein